MLSVDSGPELSRLRQRGKEAQTLAKARGFKQHPRTLSPQAQPPQACLLSHFFLPSSG